VPKTFLRRIKIFNLNFPGFTLNDVILVGGATRMPAVQKIIYSLTGTSYYICYSLHNTLTLFSLGIKPRITVNPDEAVSLVSYIHMFLFSFTREIYIKRYK